MNTEVPDQVFLQPGEVFVTRSRIRIVTVLGSCVGTVFFSRRTGTGGMSHAMYPHYPGPGKPHSMAPGFYADEAVRMLHRKFMESGHLPDDIRVWVFGGSSSMLPMDGCMDERPGIGGENYRVAMHTLTDLGLKHIHGEPACPGGQKLILDLVNYRILINDLVIGKEST